MDLLDALERHKTAWDVSYYSVSQATLEDVYLEVISRIRTHEVWASHPLQLHSSSLIDFLYAALHASDTCLGSRTDLHVYPAARSQPLRASKYTATSMNDLLVSTGV